MEPVHVLEFVPRLDPNAAATNSTTVNHAKRPSHVESGPVGRRGQLVRYHVDSESSLEFDHVLTEPLVREDALEVTKMFRPVTHRHALRGLPGNRGRHVPKLAEAASKEELATV